MKKIDKATKWRGERRVVQALLEPEEHTRFVETCARVNVRLTPQRARRS